MSMSRLGVYIYVSFQLTAEDIT